ncbi:MAG: hypothetical protein EDX89_08485 [Acidobacteria bacterium]|nr:MAG: hypothetical protein EDX89_08485 [Acidobacteriota bacterium]
MRDVATLIDDIIQQLTVLRRTLPARRAPRSTPVPKRRPAAHPNHVLQGQYLGALRPLTARLRAQVRTARAKNGTLAAIALAKKLRKHSA